MCEGNERCIVRAIETVRCGASCTEEELHEQVAWALVACGLEPEHEVRLAPRCRIDFMCGDVGIEIKKNKPDKAKLIAQLTRYAACDRVKTLVVAAPRGVSLPDRIGGKKIIMVALERLWGISLP